ASSELVVCCSIVSASPLFATEKGFIGINGVNDPIAPLEVRGDNMTLTSTNPTTTPFPQLKFTGLGESNGMMGASNNGCDFYGFRAQDGLDFTVNLGIEAVSGSPERPALTWNNANANQEFAFIYDDPTNTTSCGNLIASFCGTGAFQFIVEGDIKATGATFSSSDRRFKKEIRSISDALSMVSSLNGVTYKYRTEEFAEKNFTDGRSYGFIAQELQKVMPEAVKEDNDGYLAVNYSAVIPVLTNAIQDQQAIIEQQDAEMDALKDRLAQIESQLNIETPSSTRKAQLMQNVPNPASSSTRISYVLPDNASKATIQVLDLKTGALVKELPLTQTEGNVELSLRDLNAGMYGYTLIVDGQRVDSKLLEVSK
ncbi:MAG: tail fiber domain-containing protein, partial [Bacteroidota bacterium]